VSQKSMAPRLKMTNIIKPVLIDTKFIHTHLKILAFAAGRCPVTISAMIDRPEGRRSPKTAAKVVVLCGDKDGKLIIKWLWVKKSKKYCYSISLYHTIDLILSIKIPNFHQLKEGFDNEGKKSHTIIEMLACETALNLS
jgi:hypothetical protein